MNTPPLADTTTITGINRTSIDMHNSSTTLSWEVQCATDENLPNIDILRELEQSMQFQNQYDDDWSEDENKNHECHDNEVDGQSLHHHKSKSASPVIVSPGQRVWKVRFLYLVRCCCCRVSKNSLNHSPYLMIYTYTCCRYETNQT